MEQPLLADTLQKVDPVSITPDHVRGLSLGRVTELYGTAGLYVRTLDSLEQAGFGDNELIHLSLQLGRALHADDLRTNGHYTDHLMRVTIRMLDDFGIRDPDLIAAGPLHDVFEDHPRDLARALTGEKPDNPHEARSIGREALTRLTNQRVVRFVETVTNPPVPAGEDKIEVYTRHTVDIVFNHPEERVLKLSDFEDNAGGNHATLGPKQRRLDEKYLRQWRIHMMGLYLPDSLITGEARIRALHRLSKGHSRALGRLAVLSPENAA